MQEGGFMACVGVLDTDFMLPVTLRDILDRAGFADTGVALADGSSAFDIMLIGTKPPEKIGGFSSAVLIVPDKLRAGDISFLSSDSVISYGLRRKNTVTLSSLVSGKMTVSLQRSIPTVGGGVCGEQEFCVRISDCDRAEDALGIVSVLCVLGVSPAKIRRILFDF